MALLNPEAMICDDNEDLTPRVTYDTGTGLPPDPDELIETGGLLGIEFILTSTEAHLCTTRPSKMSSFLPRATRFVEVRRSRLTTYVWFPESNRSNKVESCTEDALWLTLSAVSI